jgi:ankyrin repeat protein
MTSVSDEEWIEATKLLIAAGANLEAIDKKRGWNALHFAVAFHNREAIKLLLQHMNRDQGKQLSYTIFI